MQRQKPRLALRGTRWFRTGRRHSAGRGRTASAGNAWLPVTCIHQDLPDSAGRLMACAGAVDPSNAASMPRALARVSSSSRSGSESATMPAPARSSTLRPMQRHGADQDVEVHRAVAVRGSRGMPVYAPRAAPSSSAMICMQRTLGHPGDGAAGKHRAHAPMGVTSARSSPAHVGDDVVHVGVGLDGHEFIDPHVPASHTRPRSLRSRSISITCSARSLGCAASSVISRHVVPGAAAARPGAGDRPRVDCAAPRIRTSRSGEELRMDAPPHCASAANGAGLAARSARTAAAAHHVSRQRHAPVARQIGLVDVAGANVLLRTEHPSI